MLEIVNRKTKLFLSQTVYSLNLKDNKVVGERKHYPHYTDGKQRHKEIESCQP